MRLKRILAVATAVLLCALGTVYLILATYDYNTFKPRIVDLVQETTSRKLDLNGDIDIKIGLAPTIIVNDVAFQNASWGSQKEMARVKHFEVKVALLPLARGHIQIRRMTAVEPVFLFEVNKKGQSNLDFQQPAQRVTEKKKAEKEPLELTTLSFNRLEVQKAIFTYNDHQSDNQHTLRLDQLSLKRSGSKDLLQLNLNTAYDDISVRVSGHIGLLKTIFDPDVAWPLDIKIEALDTTMTAVGEIKDLLSIEGIDLKLNGQGEDLANFNQIVGDPLPVHGPFGFSGHLNFASVKKLEVSDLYLKLGDSSLKGTVAVDTTQIVPRVSARIASDKLDLRPILMRNKNEKPEDNQSPSPLKNRDKVFSAEPLPIEVLHRVNADLSLNVVQALLPRIALDHLNVRANLQNGQLSIKPFIADIGGGSLSVDLNLVENAENTRLRAIISAQKIDLGSMLKKLEMTQAMEGALDLDVGLEGRGNTIAAIMAGLNGDVIIRLGAGKMPTDYLNVFGADLGTGLLRLFNPFGEKIEKARINCMVADIYIKDGMANSDIILIDDRLKTLLGNAEVNLKSEELDVWIKPRPKEGIGTKKTGKLSISMKALTQPFKLGGTLAKPSIEMDTVQTAKTVGTAFLGPVGWAWLVFSRSSGDEDICAFAQEIAGKGAYKEEKKR